MESLVNVLNELPITNINLYNTSITDKGIEILSDGLIGNISLKTLKIHWNKSITDKSFPFLKQLIEQSGLSIINLSRTSVSEQNQQEIKELLKIPMDERKIPLKSFTKKAIQ